MSSPISPISLLLGLSLLGHLGGLLFLSKVEINRPPARTVVEVKSYTPPKAPPKPPPPPPPTPEAPPPPVAPKAPPPAPKATPPAAPPPAAPAPDFGLALGNSGGGPGGIAVPVGQPGGSPVREQNRELAAPAAASAGGCGEPEVKAKALEMPHPAYTEEARAAGIEGKVRVELTLDAAGAVTGATVLQGLGHGLDEAALQAVRGARFSPATRCGQPTATTFTVAVRFTL